MFMQNNVNVPTGTGPVWSLGPEQKTPRINYRCGHAHRISKIGLAPLAVATTQSHFGQVEPFIAEKVLLQ